MNFVEASPRVRYKEHVRQIKKNAWARRFAP
jgi:hypothetical protein